MLRHMQQQWLAAQGMMLASLSVPPVLFFHRFFVLAFLQTPLV